MKNRAGEGPQTRVTLRTTFGLNEASNLRGLKRITNIIAEGRGSEELERRTESSLPSRQRRAGVSEVTVMEIRFSSFGSMRNGRRLISKEEHQ